ncbi:hypothetical protein PoB_006983400 [Plakobranchus ocellatus]|uniref:Secreted protein n=1 Tax=Plakobranchus ocellatus TaxID=259542 RepID=A0AAV4DGP3_9GAST|nr:hypothetical protein PoB_006983400 [Plakobranchus ocellatus]
MARRRNVLNMLAAALMRTGFAAIDFSCGAAVANLRNVQCLFSDIAHTVVEDQPGVFLATFSTEFAYSSTAHMKPAQAMSRHKSFSRTDWVISPLLRLLLPVSARSRNTRLDFDVAS